MSVASMPKGSLRQDQAQSSRLVWALIVSLAIHVVTYGGYQLGNRYHLWVNLRLPPWLHAPRLLTELLKKPPKQPTPQELQEREVPLMFVEVSPAQASAEPPKNAKFYSSQNSLAANPDADQNSDVPKITGTQTQVVRTEDVPRQKFSPLQPSPRPAQQAKQAQEEQQARPAQAPGDLAMAKPDLTPRKEAGQAEHTRPTSILEALARQQPENRLSGQKLKQEGGVRRHTDLVSMDAKATSFGAYDSALIGAIEARWFGLLDQRDYASDSRGRVVLEFILHPNGQVTNIRVAESTVGDVLAYICQMAIQDPAPYPPWPSDMRRMIGESRPIRFTFYYN